MHLIEVLTLKKDSFFYKYIPLYSVHVCHYIYNFSNAIVIDAETVTK